MKTNSANGTAKSNEQEAKDHYESGVEAFNSGRFLSALKYFEKAVALERNPASLSRLGLCLAKEKRNFAKAISLCKEAIKHEPRNPEHFLYLGRIHLLAGQKKEAIRIFRMGLRNGRNPDISKELERLGSRKDPLLPFLGRNNPINKFLGIVLKKTGLR
ncbi:TPR domain protein [Geotalea daltonii FRC-32]|uniref:TPR domain protein n=1 Tax=Geotalea daltonii (strain DSM 22248 / JCM 15807 / FRC-32) TaxID=316067 RepID=B9M1X4_GEODF|nr:tetratricopeptide repeat protein [Geotalea daltonii]ACM19270.1 TPR domain protein [Geotalea daltonii FRC-32]